MDIKQLNRLRHPKERILYLICAIINTAFVAFFVLGIFIMWKSILISSQIQSLYIAVISLFTVAFFSMGATYANTRVFSVRLNDNQFPELYEIAKDYARRLQLKRMPLIYIKQENGVLNAFAAYFWGRNYVHINTEIFEIAYMENKDIDAVSFIIGHEMGHIVLNHTRFWYNASILIAKFIPILGTALSRAQEYSSDRIALELCPQGKHGIFMLLLGRHLYKNVNVEEYLRQAEQTHGWFEFAINLNATHPVNTRRVTAVYKPEMRGKLLF